MSNSLFGKLVGRVPIATNSGVPSSSTPYTMFGATASLVTTSAEDLRLFRVERASDVMHKNDVMHTVIYAAFCMLPSFAGLHIVLAKRDLDRSN